MAKLKFRPLHDRVVVKRVDAEAKTKGGIIIPDTVRQWSGVVSPGDLPLPLWGSRAQGRQSEGLIHEKSLRDHNSGS